MKIEIEYKELLDVVYALRARTDVFELCLHPPRAPLADPITGA